MKSQAAILFASIVFASAEQPFEADFSPIANAGNYSTFLDSVLKTGTDEVISANAPLVTIFGPTNFAFNVSSDHLPSITDQELVDILLGHIVINASITPDELAKEGCIVATTVQGRNVSVYRDPLTGAVDVDGVQVIESISGDFGIFHALQSVLLPAAIRFLDCPAIPDFSAIADSSGQYDAFLNAMVETNQDFLVAVNLPATIFGPKDSAFNDAALGANFNASEVISDHIVISQGIYSEEIILATCIDAETVGGIRVAIRYDNRTSTISINGIPVTDSIRGENYSFLGIDGVLLEESSGYRPCTDFSPIVEAGKYGTLLDAIAETKIDMFIGQYAPVTIFGPTDDAFSDFQATIEVSIDKVIIEQHIVTLESIPFEFISQVECHETVTTGGMVVDIRYNSSTNTASVNGIPIIEVGIVGNYGILYGISGVLIPGVTDYTPCADFSPLVEAGSYSTFLDAIVQTRTNEFISEFSPVTVFAPTDSAFARVQEALAEMSDSELSENILYHHLLIYKEIFSAEVIAKGCVEAETFGGTMIAIRHDNATGSIAVNGIPIVEVDITANFGVVHGFGGILNGSISSDYIPCPTETPSASLMPAISDQPTASPIPQSTPTSDPIIPANKISSASVAYASVSSAVVIAMLVF